MGLTATDMEALRKIFKAEYENLEKILDLKLKGHTDLITEKIENMNKEMTTLARTDRKTQDEVDLNTDFRKEVGITMRNTKIASGVISGLIALLATFFKKLFL